MPQTLSMFVRHHGRRILAIAVVGGIFALLIGLVQPLRYGATMRILIIQSTSATLDAYTAVKSAEKVGRNLGRVIASSSFLDRVLAANPAVDASTFSRIERKRRRTWQRMVEVSVPAETSVMEVRVFHERQAQARAIAEAVAAVLLRDVREYTGSRDIDVKVIDPPLVSKFPVRPNLPIVAGLGVLIGAVLGASIEYLRSPHRHAG